METCQRCLKAETTESMYGDKFCAKCAEDTIREHEKYAAEERNLEIAVTGYEL